MEAILLIIAVVIIAYVIKNWYWILLIVIFSIFVAIIHMIQENNRVKRVVSARVVKSTDVYEKRTEEDGFSVGYVDNEFASMTHYKHRNVFVGRDVTFSVVYENGKTDRITAREGTENYRILMSKVK